MSEHDVHAGTGASYLARLAANVKRSAIGQTVPLYIPKALTYTSKPYSIMLAGVIAEARLNGRPLLEPILLVGSIAEFVVNLLFLTQMRDTSLFGADWTAASQTPLRASGTTKQLP